MKAIKRAFRSMTGGGSNEPIITYITDKGTYNIYIYPGEDASVIVEFNNPFTEIPTVTAVVDVAINNNINRPTSYIQLTVSEITHTSFKLTAHNSWSSDLACAISWVAEGMVYEQSSNLGNDFPSQFKDISDSFCLTGHSYTATENCFIVIQSQHTGLGYIVLNMSCGLSHNINGYSEQGQSITLPLAKGQSITLGDISQLASVTKAYVFY